jgi:dolichol-phosphate mannosyltransferase
VTGNYPSIGRVAIVVPTYNELENLEAVALRIREAVPEADLLVVDDNSPDGTGELADKLASTDGHIQVLHRAGKAGLGAAYLAGFQWALDRDYDAVIEMDADGSHQAEDLPRLIGGLDQADLVVGSRWVPGGKVINWPRSREVISRGGNIYVRLMLGIKVRDATGGFRAYRSSTLRAIALGEVVSQGYCFQIDLTLRTLQAGLTVTEIPITFIERARGTSKMSNAIVKEAFWRVTQWGVAGLPARLRGRTVTPRTSGAITKQVPAPRNSEESSPQQDTAGNSAVAPKANKRR